MPRWALRWVSGLVHVSVFWWVPAWVDTGMCRRALA